MNEGGLVFILVRLTADRQGVKSNWLLTGTVVERFSSVIWEASAAELLSAFIYTQAAIWVMQVSRIW